MVKVVGLKFMLSSNHFLGVFLPPEEAEEIVRRWVSGNYVLKGVTVIGGTSQPVPGVPGVTWALKVESIQCIHTFSWEEVQSQLPHGAPSPRPPWPPLGLSGGGRN